MGTLQPLRSNSKVIALCDQIRQMAMHMEPDEKLPTVDQLCAQLATSRVTLTEVFKELERQKVIYRQQSKGIFVSPHLHRKNIGILFDSTRFVASGTSPFWGILWGLLAQEALHREKTQKFTHSFYSSFRSDGQIQLPEDFRRLIIEKRLHGVIVIGLFEQEVQWIEAQGIPCVSFAGPGTCAIGIDMIAFIRMAVRKIASEHCHRVEIWLAPFDDPELTDLFAHLEADRALIFDSVRVRVDSETLTYQEQGYNMAMEVFGREREQKPDGLIVLDDMMATGILAAFQVLGVHLGKDVQMVTHANTNSMVFLNAIPGITVFETDTSEIVSELFRLVDLFLAGETPPSARVNISTHLRA